ncbi:mycothiol conjugate amidase Mca [Trueperella bernardiae]|uniref:mycothiol conjugate amidase Mca n=1 Tax=Trueperella bernardiae TaxID=59561 RepID=UPI0029493503|nr:mycothiol conjugate amidase Mca [Trueperella bernardiae]MDV6238694.1 mycothiol conjugate amidase Mca [Trueperella bernardiae]
MAERRLMAVHAHPDDESSKGAGTMAKYAKHGRVRVVTCTGGERGDILNPRLFNDADLAANLPAVRREEMARAAEALGIEHVWLGFIDSGLPEGDPLPALDPGCFAMAPLDVVVGALVRQIREFKPQVLLTYNENGGYPHPDHIRTHVASIMAVAAAHDPQAYPEAGEPWQVSKVYYDVMFNRPRIEAFDSALRAAGQDSPFEEWLARDTVAIQPSARVDVADFFPQRDAALLAHASQIDPDGFFFAMPRELEAKIWPWEEYVLALTTVGHAAGVETDLFERVPGVELVE